MSQDYQIAIVPNVSVVSTQRETISLSDIFGRVPVEELKDVLSSPWAQQRGYRTVEANRQYTRMLANGVTLEVRISDSDAVEVRRRQVAEASAADAAAVRARMANDASNDSDYELAVNELIVQTMMTAVPNRAREMGYVVAEEKVTQGPNQVIDMVLQVELVL